MEKQPIVLTDQEAEELYRFTRNDYINPNTYGALNTLLARVAKQIEAHGKTIKA